MMMIATMRSTPSGIVTFKDLQTLLFFFYSPQQPQKQSHKNNDSTQFYALLARRKSGKESVSCDE
jgi:hypothetical protein